MSASIAVAPHWWLQVNGSTAGPYSQAYVVLCLQSGRIAPETLACTDGGNDWRPLGEWFSRPQLPPLVEAKPIEVTPPPVVSAAASSPLALDMLKWICIYGLFVNPIVWCMSNLSCLVSGPAFHPDSPLFGIECLHMLLGFALTAGSMTLLFLGALQLKAQRPIGITLTLTGLWIDAAWGGISLVMFLLLAAAANADSAVDHLAPSDDSLLPLTVVTMPIFLASFVWEIVAMVWLLRTPKGLAFST